MSFSRYKLQSNPGQDLFGSASFVEFSLANHKRTDLHARTALSDGCKIELWDNGVLYFEPANITEAQSSILISCGVHGNETAPIELVDTLVGEILDRSIELKQRLLVVFANPSAAQRQVRFIDDNLNRLFCGGHADTELAHSIEAQRAMLIEKFTERFFKPALGPRLHYDLHTAIRGSQHEKFAVYPFLHSRAHSPRQLGFLESCGVQAVLLSNQPSTTYSYYSSTRFLADAFTIELGSVHPFGQNDLSNFSALKRSFDELLAGHDNFTSQATALHLYAVIEEVKKCSPDLKFGFPDDTPNFTSFAKGTVLASDQAYQYIVKNDGECIVFPHQNVPVGHRALLVVAPTQLNSGE